MKQSSLKIIFDCCRIVDSRRFGNGVDCSSSSGANFSADARLMLNHLSSVNIDFEHIWRVVVDIIAVSCGIGSTTVFGNSLSI
jgi:hypothetical protein